VINLTFNRRSGLLAAYIGGSDVRGVVAASDGVSDVRNPWLSYFVDLHRYRQLNRFNLVDLYALGGSGYGPYSPIRLSIQREASEWAAEILNMKAKARPRIAVQIGASDPIKAWRSDYFGQTLAAIGRHASASFVLIGTEKESSAVRQATAAYHNAGGAQPLCNLIGQTDIPQLVAVLSQCDLLLTNDTGPMHLAVGVGKPVVDLSVGHVDFHETGPYGPGHWVIQPDIACAPCGFDQICSHHTCKDRVAVDQVAALILHVLQRRSFSLQWTGVRVYESTIDEDGLCAYALRAGRVDPVIDWYGRFWRRFWFESFTRTPSRLHPGGRAPDLRQQQDRYLRLRPLGQRVLNGAEDLLRLSRRQPLPIAALQNIHTRLKEERKEAVALAMTSPAFAQITVSLLRELQSSEGGALPVMAEQQARAYRTWNERMKMVMERISEEGTGHAAEGTQAAAKISLFAS
jgi:ADP-heptose:LPS heptosyltransferase